MPRSLPSSKLPLVSPHVHVHSGESAHLDLLHSDPFIDLEYMVSQESSLTVGKERRTSGCPLLEKDGAPEPADGALT